MGTEHHQRREKLYLPPSHILVVDDEPILLDMASTMLTRLGCSVFTAENGKEAIELFRNKKDDIQAVILDMLMPILDGKATFLELKKIDPGVKVLIASGFGLDMDAQRLLSEGIIGFLQKPYRMKELYANLHAVLVPVS